MALRNARDFTGFFSGTWSPELVPRPALAAPSTRPRRPAHSGPAAPAVPSPSLPPGAGYDGGASARRPPPYPYPQADYFCSSAPGAALAALGARANLPGAAGAALRRLARDGLGWVPTAGNVAALLAFVGALVVNGHVTGGEPEAALLLAPLLLLLSPDPLLLRCLGEQQRYFPPVFAVSVYLTGLSISNTIGWGLRLADASFWALETGLLIIALPMHGVFLQHAWRQQPQPLAVLCVLGPMSGLALLLTQLEAIQYLAGIGLAMCALMVLNVRQLRRRGMKAI